MLNQFLELLDKLKELDIVRFFAQIFTEERLAPLFQWFQGTGGVQDYAARAKHLVIGAVVIAVITFAIDQAFYWTNPEQIERARRNYLRVMEGLRALGDNIRALWDRVRRGGSAVGHGR